MGIFGSGPTKHETLVESLNKRHMPRLRVYADSHHKYLLSVTWDRYEAEKRIEVTALTEAGPEDWDLLVESMMKKLAKAIVDGKPMPGTGD